MVENKLKNIFYSLCRKFIDDESVIVESWDDLVLKYQNRSYHNLEHLYNLYHYLANCKLENWESVQFAIFYHDIILDSTKMNNEIESANYFLSSKLGKLLIGKGLIRSDVADMIIKSKHTIKTENSDQDYFLDADLSILGQNWNIYRIYTNQIRFEYNMFDDVEFRLGRKKVLEYFLNKDRIFRTDKFFNKFEKQARTNIKKELNIIS